MPRERHSNNREVHFNLILGKWRCRSHANDPDAVGRKTASKYQVYELIYDALTGFIQKMTVTDVKFGKQLNILLLDPADQSLMNVHMSLYSMIAKTFLRRAENIRYDQVVRLALYNINDKETGDPKDILTVYQEADTWTDPKDQWVKVQNRYPAWEGLPPVDKVILSGQEKLDSTRRVEALLHNIDKNIVSKLQNEPFRQDNPVRIGRGQQAKPIVQQQKQKPKESEDGPPDYGQPPDFPPPYME